MSALFAQPGQVQHEGEESAVFAPRFDARGLLTAVVTDARDGALLMVAFMNADALDLTLQTGIAHFWSRSRKRLWKKGETSGNTLSVVAMRIDCDQDALWLSVEIQGDGKACHTGRRSCFYRTVSMKEGKPVLSLDMES